MSYRSALSNPLTASGSVGTVVTGANPSAPLTLANGVEATIDSITLGEGVWLLQTSALLEYASSATVVRSNFFVKSVVGVVTTTYLEFTEGVQTTTLTVNIGVARSVVINLSVPTVLSFSVNSAFSVGSVFVDNPLTSSTQYLVATKIA